MIPAGKSKFWFGTCAEFNLQDLQRTEREVPVFRPGIRAESFAHELLSRRTQSI